MQLSPRDMVDNFHQILKAPDILHVYKHCPRWWLVPPGKQSHNCSSSAEGAVVALGLQGTL